MTPQPEKNWHSFAVAKVFDLTKSSKRGLDDKQVQAKLKTHGKNKLPEPPRIGQLKILFNQIKSPLVYVLLIAGIISIFLGHLTDAGVIFFVVIINTAFGFWQESKADQAIKQLRKIIKNKAKVLRNGNKILVNTADLVPGDVIFLEAGDKVPADARLFEVEGLQTTEAPLTGESMPIKKKTKPLDRGVALAERDNMVYMGTLISRGKGMAVVCKTGINTELGKITQLIKETKEEQTPLQQQLARFSKNLTIIILAICFIIFTVGFATGRDPVEMFITVVAIAVAAIPEGLLVAVTIILTIGMQFILKKKALVRKLVAAETLGSTSIICTDKTGTLTEGRMQVSSIITADKQIDVKKNSETHEIEKVQDLISKISVLCSSATIENPNEELKNMKIIASPTERALLLAAIQSGFKKQDLEKEYDRISEIPFDSEKKYMATIHNHKEAKHNHVFIKGAPEKLFPFCSQVMVGGKKKELSIAQIGYLTQKYEKLTKKGLRVLAFAYKTGKFEDIHTELNDLVFLGFIALKDPLRPETKDTIRLAKKAGIRPILITGDHRLTARAIYEELGLTTKGKIAEGSDLDQWTDEQLKDKIKSIDIYARVEPRHKLRVVDAWQAMGEVVAMTGDGINDAPALKTADIGIALGSGSDVTKETADIILLDDNFKVIVSAVEQGRVIFDNIRKVITYLLSDSFSEMILIAGSLLLGLPLPILATQILWINLVADGLPSIALTLEPGEKEVMEDKPRKKREPILNREMKVLIFIIGIITDIILLSLFMYMLHNNYALDYTRTIVFAALGVDSLLYVFSIRSMRHSIFTKNPFSNLFLTISVVVSFFLLVIVIYIPWLQNIFHTVSIGITEWGIIIGLGLLQVLLVEIVKHCYIVKCRLKKLKKTHGGLRDSKIHQA